MQLLCFTVGDETYAIPSRRVATRPLPDAPASVRGLFVHRGRLMPLVDLASLLGRPSLRDRLSTRVIVVEPSATAGGPPGRFGVAAENVLSLCDDTDAEDRLPPIAGLAAPCLADCLRVEGRTIQCLDADRLLHPRAWHGLPARGGAQTTQATADGGRQP
jgi:chemotaxis-related protein WspB